ncbi:MULTISPECIES: archaetidylserine decarboxylase [Brevibacillus]|jgi:phosphatidylserine decarboxylase|uniref:Phosphatidylserine decarboxylase proenzyme n=2 Tax=Brevibacillus TaxID=55080 RepID=A0A1I3RBG9_9BACL|nr:MULTISPECIES: archaetidylserine decarboxylase [Brevibacillus]MDR7319297.1 phosphatidylserine decarboxylase [Brevibacillus nitrificans]MEC2130268.1 archaetidylserine decarboxylase [Brevibacillus centrosporus]MED1950105.1 archaetidylserine decarboxylase [Brevibacillus centrosporus]MED4909117.1 archaetidylserine decarboxylase [Brevibacillus centrosporus]RNB70985.1 phosphatidylserine decarboxylase [Brevibacillus centrosporus]
MRKKLLPVLIHRLPQNAMSRTMGKITASRFSRLAIQRYIRHYHIDSTVIEKPVSQYRTLKEFFCRRLKPEARPIAPGEHVIVSPVDGTVSQMGDICEGTLIQAKGKQFDVVELLGGSVEEAKRYYGGKFITIYLSPRDYHRIHMPVEGDLIRYSYLPGRLYPVNKLGIENVDRLFARNERLVTYIQTKDMGDLALVKVGALFVGSVKVSYNTATTNIKHGRQTNEPIMDTPHYQKGEELGWFEFGSTVILLLESNQLEWAKGIEIGKSLLMGQLLAEKAE